MDRQSLLVQKRQRLEELRKKRLEAASRDDRSNVSQEEIEERVRSVKQVSVAIQVDSISEVQPSCQMKTKEEKREVTRFDKAIQTMDIDLESAEIVDLAGENGVQSTEEEETGQQKQEESVFTDSFDEAELNRVVKDSIKQVNKVFVGEYLHLSELEDGLGPDRTVVEDTENDASPLKQEIEVDSLPNRQVCSMDVSTHIPDWIVVSYSESSKRGVTPGLAIVYNISKKKPFKEHYLKANSAICCIKFDKYSPKRLIGGTVDGSIVIWDIEHVSSTQVEILPILSTPSLKLHHVYAVTSIIQTRIEKNNCIVSTSNDGLINLWSANFLETPKTDTVELYMPKQSNEFNTLKDKITVSSVVLLGDNKYKVENLTNPDRSFLNQMVVATNDGKIIKLSNSEKVVDSIHQEESSERHAGRITCLQELSNDLLISSSLDWNLKLWSLDRANPLITVMTSCSVIDLAVRPNHQYQVIVVGFADKAVAQFWDFTVKMLNPIIEYDLDAEFCSGVKFNKDGDKVYISKSDGSIISWSIDQFALEKTLESSYNPDIDSNIQHHIHRAN